MSRNGADRVDRQRQREPRVGARPCLALLLAAVLATPAVGAAAAEPPAEPAAPEPAEARPAEVAPGEVPPELAEFELTDHVRAELARLQEAWLEWLPAAYEEDETAAGLELADMQATAARVGLGRLPDLSLGAAAHAVRVASEGSLGQAELALRAAERLDPGLAEPEFARAFVAAARGERSLAGLAALRHVVGSTLLTRLTLANLGLWLLATLLLAGVAFVAVLMATQGRRLLARLYGWMRPHMPAPVSYLLTLALLLWPLALPAGPFLLLVYWVVLLWGHARLLERVVLAMLLLLLGAAPLLLNLERQRLGVAVSAPARAIEDVRSGRLSGTMFTDLERLRAILPASIGLRHLLADVHLLLGQWPLARDLYLQVLEAEPDNLSARVDAGVCQFHLGDLEAAIGLFREVAASERGSAAAQFNLSQTYSELLRFDESARALASAQRLAPQEVGRWIREAAESRVIAVRGGLERTAEIRAQMADAWSSGEVKASWVLSLPPAVLFIAIAVALQFLPAARRAVGPGTVAERPTRGRLARTLLPGFAEAEQRRHGSALLALLPPAALVALPLAGAAGFRLPWLLVPAGGLSWWLAGAGLLFWLAARYLRQGLRD